MSTQSRSTRIRQSLSDTAWSFRLAWDCGRPLLVLVCLTTLVRSLAPVGFAIAARGIVNAIARGIQEGDASPASFLPWLVAGLAIAILDSIAKSANHLCTTLLEERLELRINSDILEHAGRLELEKFEDPRFQDAIARARNNVAKNFVKCLSNVLTASSNAIQIVSLITLLVAIDPLVVLLVVPIGLPYLLYQWRLAMRRFQVVYSRATKLRWTDYFIQQLTRNQSVPEVKALGIAPLLRQRYRELVGGFIAQDRKLHFRRFAFETVYVLVSTAAAYMVFFRVSAEALSGQTTVGDVAIFGGAAIKLTVAIELLITHVSWVIERTQYVSSLREFLGIRARSTEGRETPAECSGEVEVRRLTFRYPGAQEPALRDVSFRVLAGETVALVGENGSGKTTLTKLLAGLYEPDEGSVFIDGHDTRALSAEYLERNVAIVFQDYARYEATVAENIAYGDWSGALADPDAVRRAAELGGVSELVETMPQGYSTMLGREFGEFTLSGGQWQQLALARALAKDAALLVLDEPTASLDVLAERRVAARFAEIAKGRTTLVVSHRFSTIGMADRVLVLVQGRVAEQGTHGELLAANGHYARLYATFRQESVSQARPRRGAGAEGSAEPQRPGASDLASSRE